MNVLTHWPLRKTIPASLLLFSALIGLFTWSRSISNQDEFIEREALKHVTAFMTGTQRRLEHFLRDSDMQSVQEEITSTNLDKNVTFALLADGANTIISATDLKLRGGPITADLCGNGPAEIPAGLDTVKRKMIGTVHLTPDRKEIHAWYPVQMALRETELRPSRTGILFLCYDLRSIKTSAHRLIMGQTVEYSIFLTILAVCLWSFFYFTLTKRAKILAKATGGFGAGQTDVRANLEGNDELAALSRAFDKMIADRLLIEKDLAKAAREWTTAMDSSSDAVILLDVDRKLLRANKTFYKTTNTTPEEALGRPVNEIIHQQLNTDDCQVCQALTNQRNAVFTVEADDPRNPSQSPLEVTVTMIRDDDGKPISILMTRRDLTRQRQVEDQLRNYQNQLERLVEDRTRALELTHQQLLHAEKLGAIGKLSASIAHEFNNPLQGVMNILQGVFKRTAFDEDDTKLMGIAIRECERMRDLIKNLQDFNRPTSGKFTRVNLHAILNDILLLAKKDIRSKGIRIMTDYEENMPPIIAVADQIQQVFLNLLTNACDACAGGDAITITTRARYGWAVTTISDTGAGIKPEVMKHIFEPFFTTKPDVKGTGLGLSISYGIIKSHKGEILVDSEYGKGAAFTVKLPFGGEHNGEQDSAG